MIDGGWAFILAAYGVSIGALAVLTGVIVLRARRWSKRARLLDEAKRERAQ